MTDLVPDRGVHAEEVPMDDDLAAPTPALHGAPNRRRLYVASFAVVAVVAAAALAAPQLFGSTPSEPSGGADDYEVYDDFEREATDGLGPVADQEWDAVSGTFAITDGVAVLQTPNEVGPRSVTLVDVGATNGRIAATVGRATSSWGLVFRYADGFNYWYLQAAPDYAVLNVVRVMQGEPQVIGPTNLAAVRDGTEVEVLLRGADIEVQVDGRTVFFLTNNHALGAHRAGLLALGELDGASWEAFKATPNQDDPGPTEVQGPGGAAG